MYGPHHLYPLPPPTPRPDRAPRGRTRHRTAALAVRAGELSIRLGWRLVDTGLAARHGRTTGWVPQHARPPDG